MTDRVWNATVLASPVPSGNSFMVSGVEKDFTSTLTILTLPLRLGRLSGGFETDRIPQLRCGIQFRRRHQRNRHHLDSSSGACHQGYGSGGLVVRKGTQNNKVVIPKCKSVFVDCSANLVRKIANRFLSRRERIVSRLL